MGDSRKWAYEEDDDYKTLCKHYKEREVSWQFSPREHKEHFDRLREKWNADGRPFALYHP